MRNSLAQRAELCAVRRLYRIVEAARPALVGHQANISAPAGVNFTKVPTRSGEAKPACNPQAQPTNNEKQGRGTKYDGGIDQQWDGIVAFCGRNEVAPRPCLGRLWRAALGHESRPFRSCSPRRRVNVPNVRGCNTKGADPNKRKSKPHAKHTIYPIHLIFAFSPASPGHWLICQHHQSLHNCAEANEHDEQLEQLR